MTLVPEPEMQAAYLEEEAQAVQSETQLSAINVTVLKGNEESERVRLITDEKIMRRRFQKEYKPLQTKPEGELRLTVDIAAATEAAQSSPFTSPKEVFSPIYLSKFWGIDEGEKSWADDGDEEQQPTNQANILVYVFVIGAIAGYFTA